MFAALVLLVFAVPPTAPPPTPIPPNDHARIARAARDLGYWDIAERQFERAYADTGDPELLFEAGEAQRQLGRWDRAKTIFEAYLTAAPAGPHATDATFRVQEAALAMATPVKAVAPPVAPPKRIIIRIPPPTPPPETHVGRPSVSER